MVQKNANGVTSNNVQAPQDIGEVILKVMYKRQEYRMWVKSYSKAINPTDKANGGIMVAHLTAP